MHLAKWTIGMALVVLGLAAGLGSSLAAERHLGVVVNGQKLAIPVQMIDGQVVAPIRPIAELLGAEVQWFPHQGGVRIDNWRSIPQFQPGQLITCDEYPVWYDLTPTQVGMSPEEAVAIARKEAGAAFRVNHVVLTRVDRESLYAGGTIGSGPMDRPIWLVFFQPPPDSYMVPSGPPPPTYRDYWKPEPVEPVDRFVRIDARTAQVDGVREWGSGAGPSSWHGDVLQRVFHAIPPGECETFWNFPRFVGTFYPARRLTSDLTESYSTGVSSDGGKCWVRLTHAVGQQITIWTFLVREDRIIERQPVVTETR